MTGKLKVHVLFEHGPDLLPHGCAYIRDLLPLSHPSIEDVFEVSQGLGYKPADVVLLERTWQPGLSLAMALQLVEKVRADKACLVYEIDDNLLDLDSLPLETKMAMRFLCREAAGVIVSTETLKERLQGLNKNIFLIENAVDERLFGLDRSRPRVNHNLTTVGYMGTYTHDADLMMVLQPLRKLLIKRRETIEFQMVGGVSRPETLRLLDGLPVRILKIAPEDVAYPRFIAWMKENAKWDFAIAPLEDVAFTRYKSDIKFLDYSALGIPGVYSDVTAYQKNVRHLDTGYLARNSAECWYDAMEFLAGNEQARAEMAGRARAYVSAERSLQHCAVQWSRAIRTIVQKA